MVQQPHVFLLPSGSRRNFKLLHIEKSVHDVCAAHDLLFLLMDRDFYPIWNRVVRHSSLNRGVLTPP